MNIFIYIYIYVFILHASQLQFASIRLALEACYCLFFYLRIVLNNEDLFLLYYSTENHSKVFYFYVRIETVHISTYV